MKQQKKYPKTLTDMYSLMVAFDPTRATPVSGGRSEGLNLWNLAVESKTTGNREHDSGSGIGRNIECWRCGREHMKRECPKRAKEK